MIELTGYASGLNFVFARIDEYSRSLTRGGTRVVGKLSGVRANSDIVWVRESVEEIRALMNIIGSPKLDPTISFEVPL